MLALTFAHSFEIQNCTDFFLGEQGVLQAAHESNVHPSGVTQMNNEMRFSKVCRMQTFVNALA
jgi:hypothetical protein